MLSYVKYLAEQAYNYAVSAWNTAVSLFNMARDLVIAYAEYAYARAVSYAINLLNNAISLAYAVRDYLVGLVMSAYNTVINFVNNTVLPIWHTVQSIFSWVLQQISSALQSFFAPIMQRIQPVLDFVNGLGAAIQNAINWVFTQGLALPGKIAELWNLLQNNIIPSISNFVQNTVPTVTAISSDPFGYIFPYLKQYLWELLQYIIAYEMGTQKYTLPPFPTFALTGAGGTLPLETSLAIDNSDLHVPLSSLYISGYRFSSAHPGLDLGLTNGTPIYAMHDGVVELAAYGSTGYAVQVVIRGNHWWSRYAHCLQLLVEKDDTVRAGQVIALGDSTGNSTGPHLHLEIKYDGRFVDPVTVLPL